MAKRKTLYDEVQSAWQRYKETNRIENDPSGYIKWAFIAAWYLGRRSAKSPKRKATPHA